MHIGFVVGLPLAFLVVDGFCYAMISGKGMKLEDWYRGLDGALATLTTALAILPDRVESLYKGGATSGEAKVFCYYASVAFLIFILVFFIHHDVERATRAKKCSKRRRVAMLLGVANLLGIGAMAGLLLLI